MITKAAIEIINGQETNLQAFVNLYNRFGIECKINVLSDRQTIIIGDPDNYSPETDDALGEAWTYIKDKVEGYSNFKTVMTFDLEGKFVSHGVWE